ncbi:MAG: tetratricopeptide repeat protein [Candidatus Eisenbacteria bacterium]
MMRFRLTWILFAAAVVASCAYYNILWTANDEYKRVMSDPSISDFWDPYTQERVAGENAKLLTSVTKRCGKILLLYPKSKWVDDALLLMGNCFVLKREYPSAMRKFDELINLYAESELVDQARYMRAYTLILQELEPQALTALAGLIAETDVKLVREKSVFLRGRVYLNNLDHKNAITHLKTYMTEFPNGRKSARVRLDLGASLLRTGRPEEAIEVLEVVRGRAGENGLIAGLQIGRAHKQLGEYETAISIFEGIIVKSEEDTLKARARMETAGVLIEQGKPDSAISILTEADSLLANENRELKAELSYKIGMIHEKHLGDFDAAKVAYGRAGGSQTEFSILAAKKTKAIGDMHKYQESLSDSIPDSPDEQALSRFLLAEIYLEDLGLKDKALEQYKSIADSFPASTYAAKSMIATAALLEAREDTVARVYYRTVIDSFPNTVYANLARSGLGLPLADIVTETPPDTLSLSEIPTVPIPEALRPREVEIPTVVLPDSLLEDSGRDSKTHRKVSRPDDRRPGRTPERVVDRSQEIGPPVPEDLEPVDEAAPEVPVLPPHEKVPLDSAAAREGAGAPEDTLEPPQAEEPGR